MGRPNTGDRKRLIDRLEWALDNRWLTNGGPLGREFEQHIADLAGVRNCVAELQGLSMISSASARTVPLAPWHTGQAPSGLNLSKLVVASSAPVRSAGRRE